MNIFLGIVCLVWGISHTAVTIGAGYLVASGKAQVNEYIFLLRVLFGAFLFYGAWRFLG